MKVAMPGAGEQDFAWIGPRKVPVWPKNLKLHKFDKDVFFTINSDLVELQQPLIDAILDAEAKKPDPEDRQSAGQGGNKVRDLHGLGVPLFEVLNERAKRLFMHATGKKTAVVDDCWANVYHDGHYVLPHCHKRSYGSIVFALDNGEEDDAKADVLNGVLMFVDPRMESCCAGKPGYVSSPAIIAREPHGRMIVFPSQYTHMTTPYYGRRPRISIAWNLNPHAVAGEVAHDGRM